MILLETNMWIVYVKESHLSLKDTGYAYELLTIYKRKLVFFSYTIAACSSCTLSSLTRLYFLCVNKPKIRTSKKPTTAHKNTVHLRGTKVMGNVMDTLMLMLWCALFYLTILKLMVELHTFNKPVQIKCTRRCEWSFQNSLTIQLLFPLNAFLVGVRVYRAANPF